MPFCTTCGSYFDGRGSHCALHNPYLQTHYADTSSPINISYRTGTGGRYATPIRRKAKLYDDYDGMLDTYNDRNAVARYSPRNSLASLPDPITSPSHLRPLATTFAHLTTHHAITSLTYSVSPTGTRSITATANPDREQCSTCRQWFPDRRRLELHQWEFPVGCEMHSVCLREEDIGWHAVSERHERCFVRGCGSIYRREGAWKRGVVEGHVRGRHGVYG
ncbi:hypothetical protein BU26DRAFT_497000 [Trematosphaeria pertusa]|uniref:Uncharacterized protein n=1 Tax=Trematosphaeria pertusa TaxID=390896 RepID=A0A6A6HSA0_9PLEO|nr:uncharacterized protein BU26DRAFT_497000 [Trematosphaeria pertusa]KAF2241045.1 hypothetical protein BU26DRAFT_497000 [Trematosphaeria pertusa]